MMNSTEIMARLVAFDTVSSRSNLHLVDWTRSWLDRHDIPYRLTSNDEGTKQNLFASVGPSVAGGVILSGHSDVVPVEGQDWATDPFTVSHRDGRYYGRGTCDMKGFVAAVLSMLPKANAANLSRPIHLALSYDEEVGCLGVPSMIEDIKDRIPPVQAVIVGEPTGMKPVDQHKGSFRARISVTGKSGHSSQPELGVNAIHHAGRILEGLSRYAETLEARPDTTSTLRPDHTTINIGMIAGGTAPNIIAQNCDMTLGTRFMPTETVEMHLQKMREIVADATREMQKRAAECSGEVIVEHVIPALRPDPHGEAAAFCASLVGQHDFGAVSFGTEAGHFQQAGFSTLILGPGSIRQAHKPDEFIAEDQMQQIDAFLERLVSSF